LNPGRIANFPAKCWRAMDGAARTAAQHKIFRSTTSARAAGWGMMPKRISLPSAQPVTEPSIFTAKHHRAGWDSLSASGADPFANSGLMLLAIGLFSWVSKLNERSRVLAQQLAILRDSLDREIATRKSGHGPSPQ